MGGKSLFSRYISGLFLGVLALFEIIPDVFSLDPPHKLFKRESPEQFPGGDGHIGQMVVD